MGRTTAANPARDAAANGRIHTDRPKPHFLPREKAPILDALLTLLHAPFLGTAVWIWFVFIGVVVTLLALDLGVLHKNDRAIGVQRSLVLSAG